MALEFLEDNRHVAYPFVDTPDAGLHDFFVDASVYYTRRVNSGRLKLTYFSSTRVVLNFEDNSLLCDLTHGVGGVVRTQSNLGNFIVYRWVKLASSGVWFTGEEFVVQFVVTTASVTYPITPSLAYLVSSLVVRAPDDVRHIAIKQPNTAFPSNPTVIETLLADGCCEIVSGNNFILSKNIQNTGAGLGLPIPPPVRGNTPILFEAVPGAGTGVAVDCSDGDPVVKTINGQGPSSAGNLSLAGDACIWLERELLDGGFETALPHVNYHGDVRPHRLKVNSDCKACCDCSDYGEAYAALTAVWNTAKATSAKLADINKRYNALRASRLASAPCTQVCLRLTMAVFARPDFSVSVGVTVQNNCLTRLSLVNIGINPDGTGQFEAGSGLLVLPDKTTLQTDSLRLVIPTMEPGDQVSFSFNERWYSGNRTGLIVRFEADVTSGFLDAAAHASTMLLGPLAKT